ncbi:hypothetical protein SLE2022_021050 [Rubroshorea leprosula]
MQHLYGILHPSFLRIISFGSRLLGRPQRLFHQSRLSSDHALLLIWVVQCPFMILFYSCSRKNPEKCWYLKES